MAKKLSTRALKKAAKRAKLEKQKTVDALVEKVQLDTSEVEEPNLKLNPRHMDIMGDFSEGPKPKQLKLKPKAGKKYVLTPNPTLLDLVYNFLIQYGYYTSAASLLDEAEDLYWKSTSKGYPALSDIFLRFHNRFLESSQANSASRKKTVQDRLASLYGEVPEAISGKVREYMDEKKGTKKKIAENAEANKLEATLPDLDTDTIALDGAGAPHNGIAATVKRPNSLKRKASSTSSSNSESFGSGSESESESDGSTSSSSSASSSNSKRVRIEASKNLKKPVVPEEHPPPPRSSGSSSESSDSSDSSDYSGKASTSVKPKSTKSQSRNKSNVKPEESSSDSSATLSKEEIEKTLNHKAASRSARTDSSSSPSSSNSSSASDSDRSRSEVVTKTESHQNAPKRMEDVLVVNEITENGIEELNGGATKVTVLPATTDNIKKLKTKNVPFSRIPADIKVDDKFNSNKYVPYDYANKAHDDLVVTRGKGFTKEKNKKKRGQGFKGGFIDIVGKRGIKFED